MPKTPNLTRAASLAHELLSAWLPRHGGCDSQSWTWSAPYMPEVPAGWKAVVIVRLVRSGDELDDLNSDRAADA